MSKSLFGVWKSWHSPQLKHWLSEQRKLHTSWHWAFFLPFKQMLLGLCLISINVGSTLPPARQSVELENPKVKQREKLFLKYYSYLRSPAFSQGSKFTLQKFLHAEARRKQKSRNWVIPVKISKFPSKLSGLNLDLLSAAVFHTKRLQ